MGPVSGSPAATSCQRHFQARYEQLAVVTIRHALPAIAQYRPFVAAGGLTSYGASETDNYRLVGIYVGKIPNGDKPGDLPIVQSTKVELIINLKPATALGRAAAAGQ
jgi:putative tryptophan/tyrosine transport system substrate-binding protein